MVPIKQISTWVLITAYCHVLINGPDFKRKSNVAFVYISIFVFSEISLTFIAYSYLKDDRDM